MCSYSLYLPEERTMAYNLALLGSPFQQQLREAVNIENLEFARGRYIGEEAVMFGLIIRCLGALRKLKRMKFVAAGRYAVCGSSRSQSVTDCPAKDELSAKSVHFPGDQGEGCHLVLGGGRSWGSETQSGKVIDCGHKNVQDELRQQIVFFRLVNHLSRSMGFLSYPFEPPFFSIPPA